LQQPVSADALHHVTGVAIADRSNPKADVVDNFDVSATETEGNQRAKDWILGDADHPFDAAR
jgi:hypothetical protein